MTPIRKLGFEFYTAIAFRFFATFLIGAVIWMMVEPSNPPAERVSHRWIDLQGNPVSAVKAGGVIVLDTTIKFTRPTKREVQMIIRNEGTSINIMTYPVILSLSGDDLLRRSKWALQIPEWAPAGQYSYRTAILYELNPLRQAETHAMAPLYFEVVK
jgi:hypothetical protein